MSDRQIKVTEVVSGSLPVLLYIYIFIFLPFRAFPLLRDVAHRQVARPGAVHAARRFRRSRKCRRRWHRMQSRSPYGRVPRWGRRILRLTDVVLGCMSATRTLGLRGRPKRSQGWSGRPNPGIFSFPSSFSLPRCFLSSFFRIRATKNIALPRWAPKRKKKGGGRNGKIFGLSFLVANGSRYYFCPEIS